VDPTNPHIFTTPENEKQSKGFRKFFRKLSQIMPGRRTRTAAGVLVLATFAVSTAVLIKNFNENQAPGRSQAFSDVKVDKKVQEKADKGEEVNVLVSLRDDGPIESELAEEEKPEKRKKIKEKQDELEKEISSVATVKYKYATLPAVALEVTPQALVKLKQRKDLVVEVSEELKFEPALRESVPAIGVPLVRAVGLSGNGQVIAIIDNGFDTSHPFFKRPDGSSKILLEVCASPYTPCKNGQALDTSPGAAGMPASPNYPNDTGDGTVHHGTHVAGIALGGPSQSPAGLLEGVASGASVVLLTGDPLAALDWIYANNATYSIDVINISSKSATTGNYSEPCAGIAPGGGSWNTVMANLANLNIPTVVASGNDGEVNKLSFPACMPYALSVGNVTDGDQIGQFSNVGINFPNFVVAPGTDIYSSINRDGRYSTFTGTSMAAPHVAGIAAILKQAQPNVSVIQIRDALRNFNPATGFAISIPDTRSGAPAGASYKKVNAAAALNYLDNLMPASTTTAYAADESTTTVNWTNTYRADVVLGDSTDSEGQVLQATTGYGNVALVTAAYRARINPSAKVTSLTYCGSPMTFLHREQHALGGQVTEMWYMKSPPSGTCSVQATFSANPEERVLTSTIIKNVDLSTAPVPSWSSSGYQGGEQTANIGGANSQAYDSILACVYSTYPEGQVNKIESVNPQEQLWSYRGKEIASGLGLGVRRINTESGKNSFVSWTSTYALPWSYSCGTFKLNPAASYKSTATAVEVKGTVYYNTDHRQGVQRSFYNNPDFTGLVKTVEDNAYNSVDANWLTNSPFPGEMDPDTFSVRWNGYIVPIFSGEYTISARANDGVRVWIDDQLIIDRWTNYLSSGVGPLNSGKVTMQIGKRYKLRVDYYENTGDASFSLYWSHRNFGQQVLSRFGNIYLASGSLATPTPKPVTPPPVTPPPTPVPPIPSVALQLNAQYFASQNFTNPKLTRLEPDASANWGTAAPVTGVPADNFSLRWTGYLRAPVTGTYSFTTKSDGGIKFTINNQLLIDDFVAHTTLKESLPKTINLEVGKLYPIQIDYYETTGNAYAQLLWTYPGHLTKTAVEAGVLFHDVPAGSATDLNVEYYDNQDLTNLKSVKFADLISNNWYTGVPSGSGITNGDTYSVRWTGYIKTPASTSPTNTYTFYTKSDSGMRFWIGDTKKAVPDIDDWGLHNTVTEKQKVLTLNQNQLYPIKVEFYEATGNAFAQLLWSYPGQSKIAIPGVRFFH
jgi:subtilisin family serine protease